MGGGAVPQVSDGVRGVQDETQTVTVKVFGPQDAGRRPSPASPPPELQAVMCVKWAADSDLPGRLRGVHEVTS